VSAVIAIALTLVLAGAVAVVFTDDPGRQAVTLYVYGLLMSVLFVLLAAPDVALSQIVVGSAIVPLMVMLTIRKIRQDRG
jgi:energy-converting hydrogenase B subunit D